MRVLNFLFSVFILVFFIFSVPLLLPSTINAADCTKIDDPDLRRVCEESNVKIDQSSEQFGCGEGFGPFASVLCQGNASQEGILGGIVNGFFSNILGFLTAIGGIYFFFQIITAGIAWVGAGGDKNNVEQARNKIINALIGIVVVASAWVLVGIVGQFIGFNILDVGGAIDKLRL